MERYLEAGRVGRAHGLDGSFHVLSPRPRLLTLGMPTDLGEIVRRVGTDERPVVRLAGCDTREAAEALHAQPLRVALADAPALEAGRVVGARARRAGGDRRLESGRDRAADARAAERRGARGRAPRRHGQLLVPMIGDAIRSLDVAARRVDIDLGFLDAD